MPWTSYRWNSIDDCTRRDLFEGDKIGRRALKNLVRAAIDYNQTKSKKKAPARAKAGKSKKA
jgi:hypothetical protein